MVRPRLWQWLLCAGAVLACGVVHAADDGQALLDKATDVKLTAESVADLNDVIKLCQDAIKAGLDEDNTKFANGLLASTLTQRAEMACVELFERPVDPGRARKIAQLAVADLEETIRIDANQAEAQFLLGRLYGQMGEPKKALKVLDEAIRLTADEPASRAKALLVRANLHQDPKDRLADFDEAAKIAPRDPNVLRFRGMFHLAQNNLDAAVADLTAAAEIDPKDSDTQEACGIAQALAQKYDESLESFSRAIELDPNAATAYVHRGRIRAIKGDMPGALRDVEHGLRLQPGAVQALQLHASLLGSAGKYDQALVDLNALRTAMPDNPEVLTQIAAVYQASKQLHKAVATYDHLLKNDPKNASAYRGRADTYLSLGKQNESIADYEAALKLEPNNSGVLNNLAWVLATSPDDKLRDGKRAIELAKSAAEGTEFKQAHIVSTLAAAYAETGDFDTAVTWSKKAVDIGGDQLKSQLQKELESYEAHHPWREAVPPTEDPAVQGPPEKGSPASDDTARSKNEE
jgi:tetratricopeptide (TPR) repeat protein